MGFYQTAITSVSPPELVGSEYLIAWTTTSPPSTWWQVYVGRVLSWVGQRTSVMIPIPGDLQQIDIGWTDPGDEYVDYSSELPPIPSVYATLTWCGGTFESPEIAGFNVCQSTVAGGAINYAAPVATITAYPAGIYTDGFGLGGFGWGGFGESSSNYTWTSLALTTGSWNFAIVPFDTAGNSGTPATTSVAIFAPPLEPGFLPGSTIERIEYTYSASTQIAVLTWGASPSA